MTGMKFPPRRIGLGIAFMLASSLVMALMAAFVKFGASFHLTTASMVFWRNGMSLVFLSLWIVWSKEPSTPIFHKLKTEQWHLHLIRGVCSFGGAFLYFWSIDFIDLASATVLFNTMPIFVPIVTWAWRGVPFVHRLWWGIGIAFAGILFVLQPGNGILDVGSLIALLSGIVGAISVVSLRFAHTSEKPSTMLFYLFVICMIASGIVSLFSLDQSWGDLSWSDFLILIPIGVFGFMNQLFLTAATKFAPIRLLSPFSYFSVVLTMLFSWAIWGSMITLWQLFGFILILVGAVLMVFLYPKEKAS